MTPNIDIIKDFSAGKIDGRHESFDQDADKKMTSCITVVKIQ
jgi:hypothetical protein